MNEKTPTPDEDDAAGHRASLYSDVNLKEDVSEVTWDEPAADDVEGHKKNLRHAIDEEGEDVEGHKMNLRHVIGDEPAPGLSSGALGAGEEVEGRGGR